MTFLESCQAELRKAEHHLELAIQNRKDAQAEEALCFQKVEGLKMVIASIGTQTAGGSPPQVIRAPSGQISVVSGTPTVVVDPQIADFEKNKTVWVKGLVDSSGDTGISPKQIRQIARERRIPLTNTFPYVILSKLKSAQRIKEANGRYYTLEHGW